MELVEGGGETSMNLVEGDTIWLHSSIHRLRAFPVTG